MPQITVTAKFLATLATVRPVPPVPPAITELTWP
jgi:hypothetical protein